jgi:hypothetical protein
MVPLRSCTFFSTNFFAGLETGAPDRVDHHDQHAGAADYDVPKTEKSIECVPKFVRQ